MFLVVAVLKKKAVIYALEPVVNSLCIVLIEILCCVNNYLIRFKKKYRILGMFKESSNTCNTKYLLNLTQDFAIAKNVLG